MKIFEMNDQIRIVADWKKTRNGFKHEATLFFEGREAGFAKCTYLNRTWEAYEYQSVLQEVAEKASIPAELKPALNEFIANYEERGTFDAVKMVAAFGEILAPDQAARNDWKKRMMEAGLPGIDFPEDWDQLTEDEKTRRIDGALKQLN